MGITPAAFIVRLLTERDRDMQFLRARGATPPRAAAPRNISSFERGPTPARAAGADSLVALRQAQGDAEPRRSVAAAAGTPEQVLQAAVAELRDLPYSYWRQAVDEDAVFTRPIELPQRGPLQLEVRPRWNRRGTPDIRVSVTLKGRWREQPISSGFTITPANQFL